MNCMCPWPSLDIGAVYVWVGVQPQRVRPYDSSVHSTAQCQQRPTALSHPHCADHGATSADQGGAALRRGHSHSHSPPYHTIRHCAHTGISELFLGFDLRSHTDDIIRLLARPKHVCGSYLGLGAELTVGTVCVASLDCFDVGGSVWAGEWGWHCGADLPL
jgi:hypothetical protein